MRRLVLAVALGLVAAVGCTQDFNTFTVGSGGDAALTDGTAGGGGFDVSAGGSDGGVDAPADGPVDAPTDAPPDGPACGLGEKLCGSTCVQDTDPDFGCAAQDCTPCSVPNATASCDPTGVCAIGTCDAGFQDCNGDASDGCETDLQTDPDNCGGCGTVCVEPHSTAACSAGKCAVGTCDTGYQDCNGNALDGCERKTDSDPTACGSCANDCTASPGNWTCTNGTCKVTTCPAGKAECDGNPGTVCETDINTSVQNCGFCNFPCNLANATAQCTAGACTIAKCNANYADCDGNPSNGCEVDTRTDASNCGACNRSCSSSHTTSQSCTSGTCTPTCSPGFGDCSSPAAPNADNGCETNLASNANNCGACGRTCSSGHVSARSCSQGRCDSSCSSGWGNCTQPFAPANDDGCETDVQSDPNNCGACARTCSSVNAQGLVCSAGGCKPTCTSGFDDCSTPAPPAPDDGCETSVSFDADNCGGCGRKCSSSHVSTRSCSLGVCDSLCQAGYGNCTEPAAPTADNGCETNTGTSPDNCGGCGRSCSTGYVATRSCSGGTCDSSCVAGRGNCNQPAFPNGDDGCETDVTANAQNCGSCGRACSATHTTSLKCTGSKCNSPCTTGYANCSQPASPSPDNGCETHSATDPRNCGSCGRVCTGTHVAGRVCTGGLCDPTCDLGYTSCSAPIAPSADDGCELSAVSNDTNCGGCGNDCTAQKSGFTCSNNVCGCTADSQCQTHNAGSCNSSGVCVCPKSITSSVTCRPGEVCHWVGDIGNQRDCQCNGGSGCSSGQVCCRNTGCANLTSSATNCGACGRACPPSFTCNSSTCECSTNASCNAGSAGTCSGGVCTCGGTTCAAGERCLSNGTCG